MAMSDWTVEEDLIDYSRGNMCDGNGVGAGSHVDGTASEAHGACDDDACAGTAMSQGCCDQEDSCVPKAAAQDCCDQHDSCAPQAAAQDCCAHNECAVEVGFSSEEIKHDAAHQHASHSHAHDHDHDHEHSHDHDHDHAHSPDHEHAHGTGRAKHHHHQLRMRKKPARRACDKHKTRVAEMRASMKKGQGPTRKPSLDDTSLQAYFEECFCRVVNRLLAASSNPLISNIFSTLGCCASREAQKVKTVCCAKSHRICSANGTVRRGSKASSMNEKAAAAIVNEVTDPEKGADASVRLTLSVMGMDCSGCVKKLDQTLAKIPGVSKASVKSSFVLNRTQFSYDPSLVKGGSAELIAFIKKWNGFDSTVIDESADNGTESGTTLYLLLTNEAKERLEHSKVGQRIKLRRPPLAVVRRLDATTKDNLYIVEYDPQTIGARDVLTAAGSGAELPAHDAPYLAEEQGLTAKASADHLRKNVLRTIICALLTVPVVAIAFGTWDLSRTTINFVGLSLATVVQLLSYDMYTDAFKSVFYHHQLDINCLVIMSTTTAYIYSVVAMGIEQYDIARGRPSSIPEGFFETSSLLITLIMVGRNLTEYVRLRASKVGHSFSALQSQTATVVSDKGSSSIDVRLLHYHDILMAESGEKIATDGVVHTGSGVVEIDESILTGEPVPATRKVKSPVLAGSTVVSGSCLYRVTRLAHENSISTTRKLVDSAASSKSRTQEIADKVSTVLIPTVLLSAVVTFVAWAVSSRLNDRPQPSVARACVDALTYAIAVLAVSCPCALGLAVPMPMVTGSSLGMKNGIVFRTADAVEEGSKIKHVIFDKTGTLTQGRMKVILARYFLGGRESDAQKMVALLTQGNRHPVSMAVHEHVRLASTGSTMQLSGEVESIVGAGLTAKLDGLILKGGKPEWCGAGILEHPVMNDIRHQALTPFIVVRHKASSGNLSAGDVELVAAFGVDDFVRPEAATIVDALKRKGIRTHLLSGDHVGVVKRVATELGFPLTQIRGSCTPESKAEYIRGLQATQNSSPWKKITGQGSKGKVLFIGDGSNDAVALAQADVGMSMCYATDIAAGAADVGILTDNLHGLPLFLALSRRITRTVWMNIVWALLYNIFAILLAGGAFEAVGVRIEPSYAGIGELVSVLPVLVTSYIGVKYFGKTKFRSA